MSFSPFSFSPLSFNVQPISTQGGSKKRNRFRAWLKSLQQFVSRFFTRKKEEPPPIPVIPIPTAQAPAGKTITIFETPPTAETKLETLNDHWVMPPSQSVVASTPAVAPKPEVYPLILTPSTIPITQTKIALPKPTRQPYIAPYRVGEGSHIESEVIQFKRPINRSKAASTMNVLLALLDMERQIPVSHSKAGSAALAVALERYRSTFLPKRVRFRTQHDSKVDTEICAELDGREWNIDDPDLIIPPEMTHPNCRCVLEPVEIEEEITA